MCFKSYTSNKSTPTLLNREPILDVLSRSNHEILQALVDPSSAHSCDVCGYSREFSCGFVDVRTGNSR